ncbi:M23 family metallopeptidase [Streptomyces sp. AJS327]|uniref:M23 family metallopeptidase n=1 Tax=Streptomyces sp. AJS327 TaxID=2545265 RepID=UPI0015DF3F37|nr:M23 family metallopeptidase [Streptomyces sp. AJS327]MBA0051566.1 M23 family metallopeptidase [Streptomyces sp. AJS327]
MPDSTASSRVPGRRRGPLRALTLALSGGCLIAAGALPATAAESAPGQDAAYTASCPTDARISQGYHSGHDGVDLANELGTPIYAAGPGEVTESGPANGYGQWVRIRHPDGSVTEYGHMYERFVAVGDTVEGGQHIASMGNEGQSTGPHLHFEVHLDGGYGFGDDPLAYMSERGVSLPCVP